MFVLEPFTFWGDFFFTKKEEEEYLTQKRYGLTVPYIEIGIVNSVFIVSKVQVIQPSEKTTAEC